MKLLDRLLARLWPFSEIRRLQDACDEHFQFGSACIAYLDQVHAPWRHLRFNGKLYIMGVDSCERMEKGDATVLVYRTHDGIQEVAAKDFSTIAEPSPISSKVEGLDA